MDFSGSLSIFIHLILFWVSSVYSDNHEYFRCPKYPLGFCIDGRSLTCTPGDKIIRKDTGCKSYEICCLPSGPSIKEVLPEPPNCGVSDSNPHYRIVGGTRASIEQFPWQVSVYVRRKFVCGGTLISDRWVLTAAHCVDGYNPNSISRTDFVVGVGSTLRAKKPSPASRFRNVSVIVANTRHLTSNSYDIALLKLSQPINTKSKATRPICLLWKNRQIRLDYGRCVATGWGSVKEDSKKMETTLRMVELSIFNHTVCSSKVHNMPEMTFCAGRSRGGKDTCRGDSGGPLACRTPKGTWYQLGITSMGEGCGRAGALAVYTDIKELKSWILKALLHFSD